MQLSEWFRLEIILAAWNVFIPIHVVTSSDIELSSNWRSDVGEKREDLIIGSIGSHSASKNFSICRISAFRVHIVSRKRIYFSVIVNWIKISLKIRNQAERSRNWNKHGKQASSLRTFPNRFSRSSVRGKHKPPTAFVWFMSWKKNRSHGKSLSSFFSTEIRHCVEQRKKKIVNNFPESFSLIGHAVHAPKASSALLGVNFSDGHL